MSKPNIPTKTPTYSMSQDTLSVVGGQEAELAAATGDHLGTSQVKAHQS